MSKWLPWTDDQLTVLKRGYDDGTPLKVIAKSIGYSPEACSMKARRMGLSHPTKTGLRQKSKWDVTYSWRNQHFTSELPTLPYVPGIIVTGRYQMRPAHVE